MRYLYLFILISIFFSPKTASAQINEQFRPGYYYDINGNKITGFIYYGYEHKERIKFCAKPNQERMTLLTYDILGFVIEKDTFTVMNDFPAEGVIGTFIIPEDFVQVLESGNINLYVHHTSCSSEDIYCTMPTSYLLRRKEAKEFQLVRTKKTEKMIEELLVYFADDLEAVNRIKENGFSFTDIPTLVAGYNHRNH